MIQGDDCRGTVMDVHESIRGSERAMVPGEKADSTGQTFWASCRKCNHMLSQPTAEQRAWALAKGFIQSRFKGARA